MENLTNLETLNYPTLETELATPTIVLNSLERQVCPNKDCLLTHIRYNQRKKQWVCYDCSNTFKTPAKKITRPYTWAKRPNPKRLIVPEPEALRQAILKIDINQNNQARMAQALASTTYLTTTRISEVIPYPSKSWSGLTKEHFKIEDFQDDKALVISNIIVLKRKDDDPQKSIGIPFQSEPDLIKIILDYIEPLKSTDVLFPINRQEAWKLIKTHLNTPTLKFYPHLLRHIRLTHLATKHDYDEGNLRRDAGWKDGRPASTYVHLSWKDNAKKLLKLN